DAATDDDDVLVPFSHVSVLPVRGGRALQPAGKGGGGGAVDGRRRRLLGTTGEVCRQLSGGAAHLGRRGAPVGLADAPGALALLVVEPQRRVLARGRGGRALGDDVVDEVVQEALGQVGEGQAGAQVHGVHHDLPGPHPGHLGGG